MPQGPGHEYYASGACTTDYSRQHLRTLKMNRARPKACTVLNQQLACMTL